MEVAENHKQIQLLGEEMSQIDQSIDLMIIDLLRITNVLQPLKGKLNNFSWMSNSDPSQTQSSLNSSFSSISASSNTNRSSNSSRSLRTNNKSQRSSKALYADIHRRKNVKNKKEAKFDEIPSTNYIESEIEAQNNQQELKDLGIRNELNVVHSPLSIEKRENPEIKAIKHPGFEVNKAAKYENLTSTNFPSENRKIFHRSNLAEQWVDDIDVIGIAKVKISDLVVQKFDDIHVQNQQKSCDLLIENQVSLISINSSCNSAGTQTDQVLSSEHQELNFAQLEESKSFSLLESYDESDISNTILSDTASIDEQSRLDLDQVLPENLPPRNQNLDSEYSRFRDILRDIVGFNGDSLDVIDSYLDLFSSFLRNLRNQHQQNPQISSQNQIYVAENFRENHNQDNLNQIRLQLNHPPSAERLSIDEQERLRQNIRAMMKPGKRVWNGNLYGPKNHDGLPDMRYKQNYTPLFN